MQNNWLQIKGDPSVRAFLFQQSRIESFFDADIVRVHQIAHELLTTRGVFHLKIHYSSSQLTCWFADDPYRYRIFVKEEILKADFLHQFKRSNIKHLRPLISIEDTLAILSEFKNMRMSDENIYVRDGSINRINGMIGMTFSCDGSHYIDHKTFFNQIGTFTASEEYPDLAACC